MAHTEECSQVPVLLIGDDEIESTLGAALRRHGHPLRRGEVTSQGAEGGARESAVAVIAASADDGDLDAFELADRLHDQNRSLRVVLLAAEKTIEQEEKAATRAFVRVRLRPENPENVHSLVHDILAPEPDATPEALRGVSRGRLT